MALCTGHYGVLRRDGWVDVHAAGGAVERIVATPAGYVIQRGMLFDVTG